MGTPLFRLSIPYASSRSSGLRAATNNTIKLAHSFETNPRFQVDFSSHRQRRIIRCCHRCGRGGIHRIHQSSHCRQARRGGSLTDGYESGCCSDSFNRKLIHALVVIAPSAAAAPRRLAYATTLFPLFAPAASCLALLRGRIS